MRPWIAELDGTTGEVGRALELPFHRSFASGPDADDEATRPFLASPTVLVQPTHTRVFRVDLARWGIAGGFSHPRMASVHSAAPRKGGGCVLSCAATDSVLEFDARDRLVGEHWLREGRFDEVHGGIADFRRLHHDALKPHSHHPNGAFEREGQIWATCFETRELRTVDGVDRIALDGIPHDGAVQEGALWITFVDGRIEARHPWTHKVVERLDLRELSGTDRMLGWCRGIAVVGRRAWVGMSQLRSTTHREVARMLLKGERGRKEPSRVVELDLDARRIVREIRVGRSDGATIYGITPVPG